MLEEATKAGYETLERLYAEGWFIVVTARDDYQEGIQVFASKLGQRPILIRGSSVAEIAPKLRELAYDDGA